MSKTFLLTRINLLKLALLTSKYKVCDGLVCLVIELQMINVRLL